MSNEYSHRLNRLLASLPTDSFERLHPHLQLISMSLGQVLLRQHERFEHVYFPTTSAVSLVSILKNGASAEIGLIGNEGMLGTSLMMGGEDSAWQAVVQSAGEGYRLKFALLKEEFARSPPVLTLLLRYMQALTIQTGQTAVCNRHHSVDQQLCRWLLLTLDRVMTDKVHMTQDLIAQMLGVRREGVTAAAGKLQEAGLIRYSRGTITVLDRAGVAERSCECYETVRHEIDRLVPMPIRPMSQDVQASADISAVAAIIANSELQAPESGPGVP
jgi:CRP-like cAMP-binding protein